MRWISEKGKAFVGAGYTPYKSFGQEYEYTYDFDCGLHPIGGPNPDPDHHRVNSIQKINDRMYYRGTATASVGWTKLVKKNNNKEEASLFYEKRLGTVGQEKLGMQLFGLRTAFWFNPR